MRVVRVLCGLSMLFIPGSPVAAQADDSISGFITEHWRYVGLYEADSATLAIGLIAQAEVIYVQRLETGDMRFLEKTGEHTFRYSPTRNTTEDTEGRIAFEAVGGGVAPSLTWTDGRGLERPARRVPWNVEEVTFRNGDQAVLQGSLLLPDGPGPFPAVVLISQADRTSMLDVGMWLFARGIAVLAYDQRNSDGGLSRGAPVTGGYQDRQATHAEDAAAAVRFLQRHRRIDRARVGVAGWSGGGFVGAFVAATVSDLRFYVNIAGDASPGFQQASHMFVARLMREGFSDADVAAARELVDLHFGVAEGRVTWDDYRAALARARGTDWYAFLSDRYTIPHDDEEQAREVGRYQSSWPPERVYGQIHSTPTLGVFFEFDHSSAPSSPGHFLRALRGAGNGDVAVQIVPDTHHGGFVLDGMGYRFDTSALTRRSPLLIDAVADWVERQVAPHTPVER